EDCKSLYGGSIPSEASKRIPQISRHLRIISSDKFREIAPMTQPCIGLALGSCSARGWSHIGVIDALTEAGIEPDIVCGTSIGSLVGAAYVAGQLASLRQWAMAATWREIAGLMDVR